MGYKYSKGSQVIGDLKAADDTQRDTLIDFGEDQIFKPADQQECR